MGEWEVDLGVLVVAGIAVAGILFAALRSAGWLSRRSFEPELAALRAFAEELQGTVRPVPGLEGTLVSGTYVGKRVTVQLGTCSPGSFTLQFGVHIDADIDLTIQRPSAIGRMVRTLLRKPAEDTFRVQAADQESAREILEASELLEQLEELMSSADIDAIVAKDGWLYLECELEAIDPRWIRWYFNRLLKVARHYERRPIRVHQQDRFGWTGGGDSTRCPFCRDELSVDQLDLVACERCHTLHHGECFDEHGGCTIYGCTGQRSEALRA